MKSNDFKKFIKVYNDPMRKSVQLGRNNRNLLTT